MFRVLTILHTGADSNILRRAQLPDMLDKHIRHGPLLKICDAKNKPISMLGTVRMSIEIGSFFASVDFIVCQGLAETVIVGADFWDIFVKAIHPRKKLIKLDDGSTRAVVRRGM